MVMVLCKVVVLLVLFLLSVAFITLFERKLLSYIQIRQGPVKSGPKGLLQPFADALKLFANEGMVLSKISDSFMFMSPLFMLGVVMIMWFVLESEGSYLSLKLGVVFMMCCFSVSVYFVFIAGWSSNCKYSSMGGVRSVAQTISYEVSFFLILLVVIVLVSSFEMSDFLKMELSLMSLITPAGMLWFISCLAESSRTPFDFSESESELVSGFNTEYGSGPFALFFLAEYGVILFVSQIFVWFFGGGSGGVVVLWLVYFSLILTLFIWIRGTVPRMRYDKLMDMAWVIFLPVSLMYLLFSVSVKFL